MPKPSTAIFVFYKDQRITANVAIEKKLYSSMMHFLRELFAKTVVSHCTRVYRSTIVYKSLYKSV